MTRVLPFLALALLLAPEASAQLALGAQLGDPTGISAKCGQGRGAIILAAAMSYALYALFVGMRDGTYNYFGRIISKQENPVAFWLAMAGLIACLFLAAATIPYYLVALL